MDNTTKILIVDDSEMERIQLLHLLDKQYSKDNLFFAETIDEAWETLQQKDIDVLLLDIYLPGENGADLMTKMFADDELKSIPIIVITGTREDSFVKMSFEKYVYAYLHKPVVKDELLTMIVNCIQEKIK